MFTKNVFITFIAEIVSAIINFLIGVLLARCLSVSDRGVMVLVMTFPMLLFNFINMGLHEATIYFVGREKVPVRLVLSNAIYASLAIGSFVFLLLVLFKATIMQYFLKGAPFELVVPILFVIPVVFFQSILLSILRVDLRFARLTFWRCVSVLILLVGFFIVLVMFNGGIRGVIIVYIISSILMLFLAFYLLSTRIQTPPGVDFDLIKNMIRYGMKSYLQNLLQSVNYRFDVYLVAYFLPSAQVAFYGVAFSIAEIAWYLPNSIGSVLFPTLAQTSSDEIHIFTARVNRVGLALTALISLATAMIISPLIPFIYGKPYQVSIPPLLLLLPGIVAMSIHKILGRYFASRNKQQFTVFASCVSLFIIIGLNILLIPHFGIIGAAFSSTIGYIVSGSILLAFYKRESNISLGDILIIQRSDIKGLLAKFRYFISSFQKHSSL